MSWSIVTPWIYSYAHLVISAAFWSDEACLILLFYSSSWQSSSRCCWPSTILHGWQLHFCRRNSNWPRYVYSERKEFDCVHVSQFRHSTGSILAPHSGLRASYRIARWARSTFLPILPLPSINNWEVLVAAFSMITQQSTPTAGMITTPCLPLMYFRHSIPRVTSGTPSLSKEAISALEPQEVLLVQVSLSLAFHSQ